MSIEQQIEFMKELEGIYLDNMEGEGMPEFAYWKHLAVCAHDIRVAMEKDQDTLFI